MAAFVPFFNQKCPVFVRSQREPGGTAGLGSGFSLHSDAAFQSTGPSPNSKEFGRGREKKETRAIVDFLMMEAAKECDEGMPHSCPGNTQGS